LGFLIVTMLASIGADYAASPVNPGVVGTWELPLNGGRWIWIIRSNGTYSFHSEGPAIGMPHDGTFTAHNGKWSLKATNGYTDSGTYDPT